MRKLIVPMIVVGALACAEEPATETVVVSRPVAEEETAGAGARLDGHSRFVYTDWDADADQQLTETEFDQRWVLVFSDWDVDDDGFLGPDEAADAFWSLFDTNGDNIVDENEWITGVTRWDLDGVNWGDWNDWDVDADAELTETEWRETWVETIWGGWSVVDRDGLVGREELGGTFRSFFDTNDDGVIDPGEWGG